MQLRGTDYILILIGVGLQFSLPAQVDAEYIYEGNDLYHSGKIPQSTSKYSRALEENPSNKKANFNLGASLYKNAEMIKNGSLDLPNVATPAERDSIANLVFEQAASNFAIVANSISDKDTLHRAWHNIGNCYLQRKEFQKAVDAYKKSLRFDPKDEETRYNLAYALKNLPKDKKGGGAQPPPQQNQDQNQEKKQQQSQMNKEQAEQLLNALMNAEKKLQEKRKQQQQDAANTTQGKDW